MNKFLKCLVLATTAGALMVSTAQAGQRGHNQSNNANQSLVAANVNVGGSSHGQASGSLIGADVNVGGQSHGQTSGSLLGVNANVLTSSNHGSTGLLNVSANVGNLLGVKADVGAGETHCDFCGGNGGGVGGNSGW